ncbi:hypothetical protein PHYPSEUDO_008971 [Phytophthora pseudosyringae]|uniref:BED-type domain-containing protein n=1 Tax=Phytophthora pseudosyringae TaxID=221518 RepID=A0A8T1WEJ0_9STRA|nr:hypothetical protein PHYPSEUDO_008971 [Phytophthora pseudosyringae]
MVKPRNKEWELFGHKYRVDGAKIEKVDCKACHKQVSAAANRLQSHLRMCPARPSPETDRSNSSSTGGNSGAGLSDAIPTTSELIEQAIQDGSLAAEQATASNASAGENNAPPAKKRRQSVSRSRDRPRWNSSTASADSSMNVDDMWLNSVVAAQPAATSSVNKRRLEIEEKRLELEINRDEREERRERLNLEILEAQARREKLQTEKVGYEAKVLLALSRKQLWDEGVSEEEIERILPVSSLRNSTAATTESLNGKDTETNYAAGGDADSSHASENAAAM